MATLRMRCPRLDRGSSAVEFVLAIPLVLFLFFGIFELGRHYYTRLTLRSAVAEAARFAVTGNTLPDPDNPGQFLSRAESIQNVMIQRAGDLGVEVDQITITPPDGGAPEEIVTVEVDYTYNFAFAPLGTFLSVLEDISIATSMKNEPFPTS